MNSRLYWDFFRRYLTYTEWSQFYGGKKTELAENEHIKFKRLPFDHCCLTMVPFEHPYADRHGNVYELQAILDFLKQFKINPVTGEPMDVKSLIKLNMYKNSEDEYHCPTLFKPFTKNSHIVAIATTGNVFSYDAIDQLNIKTKNWKDLVDDTPIQRKDMIIIQDPRNIEKFNISTFHHIKKRLRVETEEELAERRDPQGRLKTISTETKEILAQLEKDYKRPDEIKEEIITADKFNAAHYSTGAVAASFTSTAMMPVYKHEAAIIDEDIVKYERVKKKGYVRLLTSFGPLNIELFCDVVPATCENFIKHCQNGYYNGTVFHRSIRNFMVQGGDPTGTGTGGKSIWGKKFDDEIKPNLSHSGRGVVSMANSGPNTNGSQFFITYRSCRSLDGKHTVFGKLVGGLDTLTDIEKIEVDNKDRPIENIEIQRTQVFVDPFLEAEEQLAKERSDDIEVQRKEREEEQKKKQRKERKPLKAYREGVGKYLNFSEAKESVLKSGTSTGDGASTSTAAKKKKLEMKQALGDFSSW